VSEEPLRRRSGRAAQRPSPTALGVVRVDPDFEDEYPDGDASSTEAHASLVRVGSVLLSQLDRAVRASFDVPQAAATTLAVVDGAAEPLTPSQIAERVVIASATMTSTLDLLERRGWIRRVANPDDRRSVFVEITDDGRLVADQLLGGIRKIEARLLGGLTKPERVQLLDMLGNVLARAGEVAAEPPIPLDGRRVRPARLRSGDDGSP
jgi:DNA-binding MarR family transcriptional regulator